MTERADQGSCVLDLHRRLYENGYLHLTLEQLPAPIRDNLDTLEEITTMNANDLIITNEEGNISCQIRSNTQVHQQLKRIVDCKETSDWYGSLMMNDNTSSWKSWHLINYLQTGQKIPYHNDFDDHASLVIHLSERNYSRGEFNIYSPVNEKGWDESRTSEPIYTIALERGDMVVLLTGVPHSSNVVEFDSEHNDAYRHTLVIGLNGADKKLELSDNGAYNWK